MRALTGLILTARCWSVPALLGLCALAAACWVLVPGAPVPIPAGGGVRSLLWPLVPVVACLGVPAVLGATDGDLERTSSRPAALLRLGALGCCVAALGGVAALGVRFDATVIWRNTALLLAVAVVSTRLLPKAMRWQPLVLLPVLMWLLGTDEHRLIRPWALLLLPGDRPAAMAISVAAFALAGAWHATLPHRTP
jgi:hypothetical protein